MGGKEWEWGTGTVCEQMFPGLDGDSQHWCSCDGDKEQFWAETWLQGAHGLCPAKSWTAACFVLGSVCWGSLFPRQAQTGRWRFLNPLERKILWCQCSQDPCTPAGAPEVTLCPVLWFLLGCRAESQGHLCALLGLWAEPSL